MLYNLFSQYVKELFLTQLHTYYGTVALQPVLELVSAKARTFRNHDLFPLKTIIFKHRICKELIGGDLQSPSGGGYRSRTDDPLRARQML